MGTAIPRRPQGARCRALTSRTAALQARAEKGVVAAPPAAQEACGLYTAPLRLSARRASKYQIGGETADADSPRAPLPQRGKHSSDRVPRGTGTAGAPRLNIMYRDCVNRPRGPVTQSTLCISSCVLPRPRGIFPVFRGGGSRVRQSGADHPSAPPGAQASGSLSPLSTTSIQSLLPPLSPVDTQFRQGQ